jgi:magnesium transporter
MDHSISFVQSSLEDTPPNILVNDEESFDHDTYRADPTLTLQTPKRESVASHSSISTASSNSFRLAGGRIGALATRLERAITRWARTNWADSSSSLDSSASSGSSRSSFRTANKSTRRKRRPPSLADIQHRVQSERVVAARIRARELRRTVPREFNLYAPPLFPSQGVGQLEEEEQAVRTFSLDVMLPHLESVLRKYGKLRRSRHRVRTQRAELDQPHHSHDLAKDDPGNASRADPSEGTSRKEEKGKQKVPSTEPPPNPPQAMISSLRDPDAEKLPQAWWLDVANPSWEDMKTLGKVSKLPFTSCGYSS